MDTNPDGGGGGGGGSGNNLLSGGLDLSSSFGHIRPAPSMMSVLSAATTAFTVNSGHSGGGGGGGNNLNLNNNMAGGGSNPMLTPLSFSQPYLNASAHSRYDDDDDNWMSHSSSEKGSGFNVGNFFKTSNILTSVPRDKMNCF